MALLLTGIPYGGFLAGGVFVLAAFTDSLDGYLARLRQEETALGQFLDPLADKFLIIAALLVLVEVSNLSSWIAMAFIVREVSVTALRAVIYSRGGSMPASIYGKSKTFFQTIALLAWIIRPDITSLPWSKEYFIFSDLLLGLALLITYYSGWAYFSQNWRLLSSGSNR
jgi:CDP-diacylglycerol--glycerol-3-phosphate 3-phosphatidyltransferase